MASPKLQPSEGAFQFTREYLNRLRASDPTTHSHFHQYFAAPIRNFFRHRVPSEQVEDFVHEVFSAALRGVQLGNPDNPAKLPGYVFSNCHILAARLRTLDRTPTKDFRLELIPDARFIRLTNKQRLQSVLQKLHPRDRDALYREFFLQQDRATAAREMGVAPDGLSRILFEALQRFRAQWDKLRRKG